MQSFILTTATVAILASQAEALMKVELAARDTFSTKITKLENTVATWGYDAGFVYYTISTKATLAAALAALTNNEAGVYALINGATAKSFYLGCHITISSTTQYTGVWGFYAPNTAVTSISPATQAFSAVTSINGGLKTTTDASTATVYGTEIKLASDKVNSNQTIMAGSTMKIASDRTYIECMTKVKYVQANLAAAVTSSALGSTSLNEATKWISMVKLSSVYTTVIATTGITLASGVIADAVVPASNTKYSGAGTVVAGIASTTNAVDIWTSTATVLANFDFTMTLSAVSVAKTYEQATCTQLTTSKWLCVVASCLGKADVVGTWTMKAFTAGTVPAAGNATAKLLATTPASNFMLTTQYIPEFVGISTNASPALKTAGGTTNRNNDNFAWSLTGNTFLAKVISSSLQYKETYADTTAADNVVVKMKAYQLTPLSCAANDITGTPVSLCAAAKMTAAAAATTTAAVVAGALSMATVGAAVAALAIAF